MITRKLYNFLKNIYLPLGREIKTVRKRNLTKITNDSGFHKCNWPRQGGNCTSERLDHE